jgi:hypothetical protein
VVNDHRKGYTDVVKKDRYTPEWKPAKKERYLPESLEGFKKTLEAQVAEFQGVVSGLPALPAQPIKYEGWFREAKKRFEIDSQTKTTEAHIRAFKAFNELNEQWLKLANLNYELSRVGARAKIDDLKIKAEEKEIKLQMAKSTAGRRDLQEALKIARSQATATYVGPQPPESFEDRMMREAKIDFDKFRTVIQVKDRIIVEAVTTLGLSEEEAKGVANDIIRKMRQKYRI